MKHVGVVRPLVLLASACLLLAGCGLDAYSPGPSASPSRSPEAGGISPTTGSTCWNVPNPLADVYHPARLKLKSKCQEAAGLVVTVRHEDDGDWHVLLDVDPAFKHLLAGVLNAEDDYRGREVLVLEIVPACTKPPADSAAAAACPASAERPPAYGRRIDAWGAWVLDVGHGGHAELHPLMSWRYIP